MAVIDRLELNSETFRNFFGTLSRHLSGAGPGFHTLLYVIGTNWRRGLVMMAITDLAGYTASTMVLLTFMTEDMRLLRVLAIVSNIAFITYGVLVWLPPVFCLHAGKRFSTP
jgi:hypothetical protein